MNTIIIENDLSAREALISLIELFYADEINIVAVAGTVLEGARLIKEHKPELLLLDIELDDGNAFDLLGMLDTTAFQVIFCTAFDQYAIQALRLSAADYLLKPIDPDELVKALDKCRKQCEEKGSPEIVEAISNNYFNKDKKITLRDKHNIYLIRIEDIYHCQSEGAYTRVFLLGSEPILVSKNLKHLEELLSGFGFFRIHHSHLIHLPKVVKVTSAEGDFAILENGESVPIASRRKEAFFSALQI